MENLAFTRLVVILSQSLLMIVSSIPVLAHAADNGLNDEAVKAFLANLQDEESCIQQVCGPTNANLNKWEARDLAKEALSLEEQSHLTSYSTIVDAIYSRLPTTFYPSKSVFMSDLQQAVKAFPTANELKEFGDKAALASEVVIGLVHFEDPKVQAQYEQLFKELKLDPPFPKEELGSRLKAILTESSSETDLAERTSAFAEKISRRAYEDRMLRDSGILQVSWATVRFQDIGIGVLSHELAHHLSSVLITLTHANAGKYYAGLSEQVSLWEKRKCINNINGPASTQSDIIPSEKPQTEEDWADLVSGFVIKKLSRAYTGVRPAACALMQEYKLNYLPDVRSDAFVGSHSSRYFRLSNILMSFKASSMPNACARVISKRSWFSCYGD